MIYQIDEGLINDDFIHDRVTGKFKLDDSSYYPIKIYNDGRIVGFSDQRFSGGEYIECELDSSLITEIQKYYGKRTT